MAQHLQKISTMSDWIVLQTPISWKQLAIEIFNSRKIPILDYTFDRTSGDRPFRLNLLQSDQQIITNLRKSFKFDKFVVAVSFFKDGKYLYGTNLYQNNYTKFDCEIPLNQITSILITDLPHLFEDEVFLSYLN